MTINGVLEGLTRRQLEELQKKIEVELRSCAIDSREGAVPYLIKSTSKDNARASIMLCKPCFEKLRQRESLAKAENGGLEG